ncbi:Fe-S cluster assembly protein SufD [Pelomicrobium methylotrophicum]|uniref:Fe-S cluster assembly protein SufD n=1 Tax=Pelomicrobium methylotrophicum TaxID=2602750 RepID=A0A5C7EJY3_9PROT|nr:Fe-S cluster assembly protein SufD [Pelomicrobium methylotrophicum]
MADLLPGHGVPWVRKAREQALERFRALGFPTLRDEDWKYTSVALIEKRHFAPTAGTPEAAPEEVLAAHRFPDLDADVLVFVGGRFAPQLSRLGRLPEGAMVCSLAELLERGAEPLVPYFGSEAPAGPFAAMNTAFASDGAFVHLRRGVKLPRPLHLLFIATGGERAAHLRHLVLAEEGAEAVVIEHYVGVAGAVAFTNTLTQISVGPGAAVEHVKLQQEDGKTVHMAGIHAEQRRDSRFVSHSMALGAQLARNDITVTLNAEGCEATLNGLYLVGGRQHVDHHTRIDHAKPHGTSREYYRGVLDGAARGVFNGRVVVHPGAQKTDAEQTNNNLVLSRDAEVDTKPQLEIYADDVKCAHGATVGQLDADMLFYLRSRGLGEVAARNLLTYAFANDVINRIGLKPLRIRLEEFVIGRLPEGESIRELV